MPNEQKKGNFSYVETGAHFEALCENGTWNEGEITEDPFVRIHQGSTCLHYAQQCFEGMKAYKNPQGRALLFRPEKNWERMVRTARRIMLPAIPRELFMEGVLEAVRNNMCHIPTGKEGGSLYVRPLMIGYGENLGLNPAKNCLFRVFVSPVKDYFKADENRLARLVVAEEYDRAAPLGIGNYKAGANYAGGLLVSRQAREKGYDEALYLDAKERRYLDEAGSANVVVLFEDGALVSPRSPSVLPSITRQSIMRLAKEEFDLETREDGIPVDSLDRAVECGLVGTAVVLTPVGEIVHGQRSYRFPGSGDGSPSTMGRLRQKLLDIQTGVEEDRYGWTRQV